METRVLFILTTLPDLATAERLAMLLVESGQAACVSILHGITSLYRWEGRVERTAEVQLQIKADASRYRQIEETLCAQHPYEVPEIVAIPLARRLPAYLRWVSDESADRGPSYA